MIEISDDTEDGIVCASLEKSYEYLHRENFYKEMFSTEPYENIVQVHLLRDAMKRVYEYYSTNKLD